MNQINFSRLMMLSKSRWTAAMAIVTFAMTGLASGHHPDRENEPVRPRVDLIGPIGNHLPPGHRRTYNRPTYWGGKIAYHIAPTSQEAMAWHRAEHAGAYESPKKDLRLEQHYFYPKPWQALNVGPRRSKTISADAAASSAGATESLAEPVAEEVLPELEVPSEPLDLKVAPIEPVPAELPPQPAAEPELELPEIELNDESGSPSDAVKLPTLEGPTFGKVQVPVQGPVSDAQSLVKTVSGKDDGTKVSRASNARRTSRLDVMEKPLFFRRWMTK